MDKTASDAESRVYTRGGIASLINTETELDLPARLPSLSEGFKNTFQPGRAGRFEISSVGQVADIVVGGSTITWSA